MSTFTIKSVVDAGGDVLLVTATATDGQEVTATGWVSTTTNHYDPDAYEQMYVDAKGNWQPCGSEVPADAYVDVHLKPDAQPRAMTAAEVGEYALQLLAEQNPPAAPPAAPAPIAFTVPA